MLINLSNHPKKNWSAGQLSAAGKLYGDVVDIPFPSINPSGDDEYIDSFTDEYLDICLSKVKSSKDNIDAIHLMGELTFTFNLLCKLLKHNITCVSSTTERKSIEKNGKKLSEFNFVKFREYKLC